MAITLAVNSEMPTLAVNDFNLVCATLGGFITLFGLVSYLFKERLYLSEACMFLTHDTERLSSYTTSKSNSVT